MSSEYCCALRRYFILGIVGTFGASPRELLDATQIGESGRTVVVMKFCPFCGVAITKDSPTRTVPPLGALNPFGTQGQLGTQG